MSRFVLASTFLAGAAAALAQPAPASLPPDVDAVIRKQYVAADLETRYLDGSVDLNGDGRPDTIVHVVGPTACGSGGCPTLVFAATPTGHRLVSTITVSRPPIGASQAFTNGWRNLVVHVVGGGAKAHDAELAFDGTSYPRNPTMAGARVKPAAAGAEIVITPVDSFDQAKRLPATSAASPAPVTFRCQGREHEPFTAAFNNQTKPKSALFTIGDRQVAAVAVATASGSRYQGPGFDFWEHQGEAAVTWSGARFTCTPVK